MGDSHRWGEMVTGHRVLDIGEALYRPFDEVSTNPEAYSVTPARYAFSSALNNGPWFGTFRWSSSWPMASLRKVAGWRSRSASKVRRPLDKLIGHARFIDPNRLL